MKRILITGAFGQIGTALSLKLAERYGKDNVLASDIKDNPPDILENAVRYNKLDIMDENSFSKIIDDNKIDTVFHLAAILSATGEKDPFFCWDINMNGTLNLLKLGLKHKLEKIFIPSSIAVWGAGTPLENTPQESVLKPSTMYGVTKVSGELLCDYFFYKYGLDCRGLRYPGIISSETLPGGGTTDYAVEIFYEAIRNKHYNCFLSQNTTLPMMYMPDCIKATIDLMEADINMLKHHGDFNVAAMSFNPQELANEIKKHIPEFTIEYNPDYRQKIADSWPRTIDDSSARNEWNWNPDYNLESMTKEMIKKLKERL